MSFFWLRPLAIAIGMVLAGTSCGGPSAEETFADDVCSKSFPNARQMLGTFEAVNDSRAIGGREGVATLVGFILRGKDIAERFETDIGTVHVPDSEAGRQAERLLELQAARPLALITEEEENVLALSRTMTLEEGIRAFDRLELVLVHALGEMTTIPATIAQGVPPLKESFQTEPSCRRLDRLGRGR